MVIIGQTEHLTVILREIVHPFRPSLTHDEAGLLLDSHNGNAIFGAASICEVADSLADTVWEHLLYLEWGDTGETLDALLEEYDEPINWGPEITEHPNFKFVERLRRLSPHEAVALQLAILDWWAARTAAGSDAHDGNTPHLALNRFFNIQA
ncbi:MAG TPA: hypothetical protein PLL56_14125 [Verrucomicrobiota bacterium]|jgi:hypothetical protein|nr:hypothetical protein [Verrucomicrobiota bacterium]